MKKLTIIILLFISMSGILSGCSQTQALNEKEPEGEVKIEAADRLEVYYFHRTARCYSCNTIGEYVAKTLLEQFPEQMDGNIIDYKEINVDLPENKEIAKKYKATGSSFFINRIIDGQDNIEHDVRVWQLIGDEEGFKDYLGKKLKLYLGL